MEQLLPKIPFFLAELCKPSDSAPNTNCGLRASCTCVCVSVYLWKTNWGGSHWQGRGQNSRLVEKPVASRQVETAIVFSLHESEGEIFSPFLTSRVCACIPSSAQRTGAALTALSALQPMKNEGLFGRYLVG